MRDQRNCSRRPAGFTAALLLGLTPNGHSLALEWCAGDRVPIPADEVMRDDSHMAGGRCPSRVKWWR